MDHRGYLVVVIRISDRARAFHLVAVFIVLQENQLVFETVLLAVFYYVTTRDLQVRCVMADADQAQYNALNRVFGHIPGF
ncbi:hypothetical protein PPTG_24683 [Phytophthora nicotianae INRA-310]|uniref:Uncharacterized protein n=1 Tax=Phytophthora nicotianae (strain INRA-310) TaxID=761204 RepID=W2PB09_PHYN3|nr:hypothetical protein PPTG_24683 [Phytophthora nicotianae INRA-310]ETM98242.1 hypothetical protein PPTG_24683 [Phytophthora nicotianae INRA-310]